MRDETAMELLPLILHQAGDLAFLAAQHRASGKFANIPFAVQPEGYSVDIGNGRCRVLGSGGLLDRAAVLSVGGHDLYLTIARYCEPYYLGDSVRCSDTASPAMSATSPRCSSRSTSAPCATARRIPTRRIKKRLLLLI